MPQPKLPYRVSAELLAREDFRAACAERDFGLLFRLMKKYDGASQNRICSPVDGLTQSRVSRIMRGDDRVATLDLIERIIDSLKIPGRYIGLAPRAWESETTAPAVTTEPDRATSAGLAHALGLDTGDVTAVFPSRQSFFNQANLHDLFAQAHQVRAVGLSLNLICQQFSDQALHELIRNNLSLRCLFLDPDGHGVRTRETEEGYEPTQLAMLTRINIAILQRIRSRLAEHERARLELAVYDETIRFNVTLIDDAIGIVQPYLPSARGLESPTLLLESRPGAPNALLPLFADMFEQLWQRGIPQ